MVVTLLCDNFISLGERSNAGTRLSSRLMFLEVEFQKILNIFKFLKVFKIPCTRVLRDNFTTFPESIIPVHAIEIRLSSRLVFPEVETQKISYKL